MSFETDSESFGFSWRHWYITWLKWYCTNCNELRWSWFYENSWVQRCISIYFQYSNNFIIENKKGITSMFIKHVNGVRIKNTLKRVLFWVNLNAPLLINRYTDQTVSKVIDIEVQIVSIMLFWVWNSQLFYQKSHSIVPRNMLAWQSLVIFRKVFHFDIELSIYK